jgi:hypothetical protein
VCRSCAVGSNLLTATGSPSRQIRGALGVGLLQQIAALMGGISSFEILQSLKYTSARAHAQQSLDCQTTCKRPFGAGARCGCGSGYIIYCSPGSPSVTVTGGGLPDTLAVLGAWAPGWAITAPTILSGFGMSADTPHRGRPAGTTVTAG